VIRLADQVAVVVPPLGDFMRLLALGQLASAGDLEEAGDATAL